MSLRNRALASPVMAVWSLAVVLLLAAGRPPLQAQDQTPPGASYRIDTFAGSRDVRDNGPATAARLNRPRGVAVDGAGNLYIADRYNHRIRKVDSTGVITTIAGTGEFGDGGDGGPATQAQLAFPTNVAVDGAGNLYIADASNHRIRRVDPSGSITTIAGTGERGFAGDGGPATQAQLAFPTDVAVDGAGNLYIADAGNHRIRRVDPSGSITTIAGTGERGFAGDGGPATQARLYHPSGVAVDRAGNLYIADSGNHRIRRVSQSGTITTIAGTGERGFGGDGGPAVEAQLYYPRGVAVGQMGDLYIADISNHRIRRVGRSGTITTFAGTRARGFSGDGGPATQARLYHPSGVAVGQLGDLYIADISNHRIRKVDSTGVITTIAGTGEFGDGGPATQALLYYPVGVAVGQFGDDVYIADTSNHRIRRVDPSGTITTFAGTGERGCCLDGAPPTQALLYHPDGVAVDVGGTGDVYIADTFNHRIRRVGFLPTITTFAGTGEFGDGGDGGPATQAQLRYPRGVALYWELYGRWAGREGERNLYIADSGNHRIRRVDPSGTITTFAGTGESGFGGDGGPAVEAQLNNPAGVAVDRAGYVYIADTGNHLVRRVDLSGTITTLAGTGASGFSGDGGPAVEAQLYDPSGVAVDGAGNVYIADTGNHLVRKLTPGGGSTPPNPTGPALTPGLPVSFSRGPVDSPTLFNGDFSYQLEVPEDATRVTFTLESVDPDIDMDLFVRYGEDIDLQNRRAVSDYSSEGLTGNEEIVITPQSDPPLRAGTYFVSVALFDTGVVAMATLRAEFDTPQQTGGPTYYFPHLAVGASWQTTITYINYSPEEVTCQTDFISDHGTPLVVSFAGLGTVDSRTDVLPPGGSVHQETDVALSAPLAPGWARATCSGPVQASLLFRGYNSEGMPVAEAGVNAATVPATRFVTFAEQGEGKNGTGVAYANPSDTAALVTFTARDADGEVLAIEDLMLPPNGHGAQNMPPLFDLSSFTGSLEVTSTEPIVSLSLNFEAAPVFSSLPPGELDAAAQ